MALDILMPLYGRTDHFVSAVESVLAQTDEDWRLVVVDDRNPDPAAAAWFRSLDDPRLHYVLNEQNLGPARNFQRTAEQAVADRAVLMGCDDLMLPGYVARIARLAELAPDAAIIQPGVRVIDGDGAAVLPLPDRVKALQRPRSGRTVRLRGEGLATSLLHGNWLYFPSIAWRTAELRRYGFPADRDVVQDLTLVMDIVLDGGLVLADPEVVFSYRRHAASVSFQAGPDGSRFAEERELFDDVRERARRLGWTRAARAAALHWTSRLNAASQLPQALLARDPRSLGSLVRHAAGR